MVKWDKEAQRAVERLQGLDAPPPPPSPPVQAADTGVGVADDSRDLELGRKGEDTSTRMLMAADGNRDALGTTVAASPGISSSRLSIIPEAPSSDESQSLLHWRPMPGADVGGMEAGHRRSMPVDSVGRLEADHHNVQGGSSCSGPTGGPQQGSDYGLTDANVEVRAMVHQVADPTRDGGGGGQIPTQSVK
jgi:hypothetical protein